MPKEIKKNETTAALNINQSIFVNFFKMVIARRIMIMPFVLEQRCSSQRHLLSRYVGQQLRQFSSDALIWRPKYIKQWNWRQKSVLGYAFLYKKNLSLITFIQIKIFDKPSSLIYHLWLNNPSRGISIISLSFERNTEVQAIWQSLRRMKGKTCC